jgi:hypothetical protein
MEVHIIWLAPPISLIGWRYLMFEWVTGYIYIYMLKMNRDIFDYLTNKAGSPKMKVGTLSIARDVSKRKVTPSQSFGMETNREERGSKPILIDLTISEKERWKLLRLGPSLYQIPYLKYTGQKKGLSLPNELLREYSGGNIQNRLYEAPCGIDTDYSLSSSPNLVLDLCEPN